MFGLRSARGRAITVGLVLTVFLVSVTAFTVWRNQEDNHQLHELGRASDAAAALEHARAQLYLQTSLLSRLAFSQDASLADQYRQAQAALEQDLVRARAEAVADGDETQLAILDDLTARMTEFEATANLAIPLSLEMDTPAAMELADNYLPSVWHEVEAMFSDLDQLVENGRADLTAERTAMDDQADVTFWLIVARSIAAFVLTAGIATVVLLSILRPLASVRLSARAIASGNLNARAKVFGPEEVASLARDFNRMTDALAAKTEEYITTTNLTGDIIGKVDAQGKWTFLNDAACQFLGKPRERLLGTEALASMHPDDQQATREAVREVEASKEPRNGLVNRVVTPMGTRVVEWNAYPLFDKQGQDLGIQITGRDVTERKQAEEALRQAEQRYRELFEEAPAMYVICRDQGGAPIVADCNELFLSTLGYVRDEVVGRPMADFYTPESRAQLSEGGGLQRALAGQFVAEERQLVTTDGSIVSTMLRAVPETGPDGRVRGVRAMYMDITARMQAEETARQSEARYRLLAENTTDLIWTMDLSLKYTYMSPAITRMRGYTVEEIIGTTVQETMTPASLEVARRTLAEQLAMEREGNADPNRSTKLELEMYCKDGSTIWTEMNMTFLRDADGRPTGILGVTRDITERKRTEDELKQAEERYRELFEEAPVMYVICRDENRAPIVADCNELFLTTLGYARDEVVQRPVADFYTPKSRAALLEGGAFQRALAGQFAVEERQLLTHNGTVVETVLHATPQINTEGQVLGTLAMYVDITERKQAEQALEESEKHYRLITENATDLIWTTDMSLRYTYISPSVQRLRGYTVEEAITHKVEEDLCPSSLDLAMRVLAEELAKESSGKKAPYRWRTLELEHFCKVGSTIWLEVTTTFLRDEDGRPVGLLGSSRDISERKSAQQALEESERRYRLIAENATDVISTMDMNQRYTYVSPSITRMRGYSPEEIVGATVAETLTPASVEVTRRALGRALAAEDTGQTGLRQWRVLELEMYCKDGSTVWTEVNTSFLRDSDGRPTGILSVTRDISQRKRSEAALQESEEKYRRLVQDSTDGIAIVEGLEVKFVNRALLEMYGAESEDEMVGRPLTDFVAPEDRELMAERSYARERGQDAPDHYEFKALRKDGTTFHAELSVGLITYQGRAARQGVIRDITERRQAVAALEQSEERYRLLAENASDIIWTMDMNLRFTYESPSVTRIRGYTPEEAMALTIEETLTPASLEVARKALAEELAPGKMETGDLSRSRTLELEHTCKDGSTVWLEVTTTFLRDADGQPIGLLGVSRDVSERRQAAEALEESEKRYRLLAENVSDVIFTTDLTMRYTYVSPSVTRIRGYSVEEVMAGTLADSLTPQSFEEARKVLTEELVKAGAGQSVPPRTVEVELNRKDGSTIWTEVTATFLRDPDGQPIGLLGVSRDITERKRAEEERNQLNTELEARAVTDSLTGLYNHAYFYQRLADEIERAKRYGHRFALMMMDVDAFKHYNDSRGHQAGDAALHLIGECIRSAMRRSDLAFRYGGDEFVAILLNADVSRAQNVVRRINRRIATRLKEAGDSAGAWLGVSAGIACYPADATTVDELVGMADAAMYDAKRLAWARGMMGQRQTVESAACPVNTLPETQTSMLSGAASSLSAALQDLTGPNLLTKSELRTIAALGAAAEIRDPFIRGHQERTSRLAATVAKEMGLSAARVRNLTTAGLLHDLGKVSVGESILNKPGKLSESEFAKMKEHPALGASMIASGAEALQPLAPIVRHHHERFDGGGYPDGLARENIPLEARILSVVDAFDAMTHERAYRKALSTEEALGEIERGAGTRFDHAVVQTFLGVVRKRGGEPA
jgi:diguanylate cyclase (GGDEF)-like protein/PAS domain S-box-containing protein